MGLPFSMIFAIILIVVFIIAAFMGVRFFLSFERTSGIGLFYQDLQKNVNDAWNGQSSSAHFKIDLPSGVKKVCFANLSATITNQNIGPDYVQEFSVYNANTFLIPPSAGQNMKWKRIKHINITRITERKNPYCVDVAVGLTIKKGFYDKLVWIE